MGSFEFKSPCFEHFSFQSSKNLFKPTKSHKDSGLLTQYLWLNGGTKDECLQKFDIFFLE